MTPATRTRNARVWLYSDKQYADLGARRWEIEWLEVSPAALKRQAADASYEIDVDRDLITCARYYTAKDKALAGARYYYKKRSDVLAFGSVIVTEQVVDWYVEEDNVAEWTNVGESIYVD